MTHISSPIDAPATTSDALLRWSGGAWFVTAAVGQLAFIGFILGFYGVKTLSGDLAGWNDKPLIDGYIEGDTAGNSMFAAHALMAAVMTLTGLMQLTPQLRRRAPERHPASGRLFLVTAGALAAGGLWVGVVGGGYLSVVSLAALALNAVLILAFAPIALHFAMRREIDTHRRWAMRLFMVASGVWFLRIFMMAWIIIAQGPVGMNRTLSGPMDVVMVFGCYLIPLAFLELYRNAQESRSSALKIAIALLVLVATGVTAAGVFGTVAFMWGPYM